MKIKILRSVLFLLFLASLTFEEITYIKTLNGINDELKDQSYEYEFSCVFVENKTIYFCDNKDLRLYSINISNDETKRIKTWDDITSLWRVIVLGKNYIILDRENQSVYFDDNQPGIKQFGHQWDPHIWDPVDMGVMNKTLFVLDKGRNNIRKYNLSSLEFEGWICREGTYDGEINQSNDFHVMDNKIYIADTMNDRIEVVDPNCSIIKYYGINEKNVRLRRPKYVYAVDKYIFAIDCPIKIYSQRLTIYDTYGESIDTLTQFNCTRYDRDGDVYNGECVLDDVIDLAVLKDNEGYYIFVATEDYIDVFYFKDTRTRSDLVERISNANKTLSDAEELLSTAEDVFNYSYDIAPIESKLSFAKEACNDKDYKTCETYLTSVEKWINETYPEKYEVINKLITNALTTIDQGINNIEYTTEQEETFNELLSCYTTANISYHDGALVNSMKKIKECYSLFEELNINVTRTSNFPNTLNNTETKELENRINSLNNTIIKTKNKIKRYSLNISLEAEEESLVIAEEYLSTGDYKLANQTLNELNRSLSEIIDIIDSHEEKVEQAKSLINEYYSNFTMIANTSDKDYTKEENDFKMANSIVEEEPERAVEIASQAYNSALEKSKENVCCLFPLLVFVTILMIVKDDNRIRGIRSEEQK